MEKFCKAQNLYFAHSNPSPPKNDDSIDVLVSVTSVNVNVNACLFKTNSLFSLCLVLLLLLVADMW